MILRDDLFQNRTLKLIVMETKYFANCSNLDEMNARYSKLIDALGLDFQPLEYPLKKEVYTEYNALKEHIERQARIHARNPKPDSLTVKDIARSISKLGLTGEVCGRWLWVTSSQAHQHREELKNLGFRYSSNKRAWYWRRYEHRSSNSSPVPLEAIREKYGSFQIAK